MMDEKYFCKGSMMMMKKLMLLVLALCLAVLPTLAEEQADPLAARAVSMAQHLDALADSEDYLAMMSGSQALTDRLKAWGEGDHSAPRMILKGVWSDDTALFSWLMGGSEGDAPSDAVRAELSRRVPMSLASMFNAMEGTEALAAASMCTSSAVFACEMEGAGLYLLLYDEGAPVLVAWYGEEGAVCMQAAFLASAAVADWASQEDAMAWLNEMNLPITLTTVE